MPFRSFPEFLFPVTALQASPTSIDVTFNAPVVPGPLDAGNWSAKTGPATFPTAASSAEALGPPDAGVVRITLAGFGAFTLVSYNPPPFDVTAVGSGVASAAFTDFPVM